MSDADRIAAYIAARGVTKVAQGESNGMTARDWRDAASDKGHRAVEHNAEREAEAVREAYHVGGRSAALDVLAQSASRQRGR